MSVILYVETNLIMGVAKGQDAEAEDLLLNIPATISIAIPSICFLEARMTFQQEEKYNQDFISKLIMQISEAERDVTSEKARSLYAQLQQSRVSFLERINDTKNRFKFAYDKLTNNAEEIPLGVTAIQDSIERGILEDKHLIDKIILECIIHHARLHPNTKKAFLSFNTQEFSQRKVTNLMRDASIQYFSKTTNFLGWLEAQNP